LQVFWWAKRGQGGGEVSVTNKKFVLPKMERMKKPGTGREVAKGTDGKRARRNWPACRERRTPKKTYQRKKPFTTKKTNRELFVYR